MKEEGVRDEGRSVSDEEGKVSEQWGWMRVMYEGGEVRDED